MKKHIWYVEAKVTVPVVLHVLAETENEAFGRAMDGAWHNVVPDWDNVDKSIKFLGSIKKGPGTNL